MLEHWKQFAKKKDAPYNRAAFFGPKPRGKMTEFVSATTALDNAKLSKEHWRVWALAAMGIFLDGFDLFIIAIALPFIILQYPANHMIQGLIVTAAPLGCIFGATLFGRITDQFGRKALLLLNILFFVVFAGLTAVSWNLTSLMVFRFLLGIGIGADYPVSSTYITENMPKKMRGKMLVSGFGFQALGILSAAVVGLVIIKIHPAVDAWRWMLGIAVLPAVVVLMLRFTLPESTRWLIHKGKHEKAALAASRMTGKKIKIEAIEASAKTSFLALFSARYIKRTLLTAGTWFIFDVALYGTHFFFPIILTTLAFSQSGDAQSQVFAATTANALIDLFLIVGVIICICLVEKWGRIKLQSMGFFGMAVGFLMVSMSHFVDGHNGQMALIFIGFVLFNLMSNAGPNPITFLLPAELFPTHIRATGHGFAAACGKVGAVLGGILIPTLIGSAGISTTMLVLGGFCLVGCLVTLVFGDETKGKSLDDLGKVQKNVTEAEVALLNVQLDIRRLTNDIRQVEGALSKAIDAMRSMNDKKPY